MGLKTKSVTEIFTSLVTWVTTGTQKITDFNVGSATRTLLESVSLQIEEFYFDMRQNIEYAVENAIYNAFGFDTIQSSKANGYVTVSFNTVLPSGLVIQKGTLVSTPLVSNKAIYFEVTENVTALAGASSIMLPVQCTTIGTTGNVSANEITIMVTSNSYVETVTNTTAFNNGTDKESASDRKIRFKSYIKSLQRGTLESITYGAKSVPNVSGVWVDDNYIGFIRVYVHDSHGELPDALKANVLTALDDYRAAGIEVEVLPVVKVPKNLSFNIVFQNHTDIASYVSSLTTLITNFLNNFKVADDLFMSNVISAIMDSYKDVIVNIEITNGSDSNIQDNELIVAGTVVVSGVLLSDWRN